MDRNKAKRRLRHAIKEVLPKLGKNGYDYVVVATKNTIILPWEVIKSDLEKAFKESTNEFSPRSNLLLLNEYILANPKVKKALEEIEKKSSFLKILGSYPKN